MNPDSTISPAAPAADAPAADASAVAPPRRGRRRLALGLIAATVLAGGAGWGAWWATAGRWVVSTDNAYVSGNVVQITPQVGGTVRAILADDTDLVKAGQPLVQLDAADARVALEQAEAQLAQTVREVRQLYANENTLNAQVAVRQAEQLRAQQDASRLEAEIARARSEVSRAQEDLRRRQSLTDSGAVSREEIEHAATAFATAQAALRAAQAARASAIAQAQAAQATVGAAREQVEASRSLTAGTGPANHPNVQRAAARVREAWLALRRTEVAAPVSGYVAKRSVQLGQRVAPGAPLMAVVPLDQVWVDANFKEVQLRDLRIGQPVRLVADAYGDKVEYDGRIAGLGVGTGAAFSLLPAQNATGNWIKVVQRVPVRVELDAAQLRAHPLRVGLSMEARVDVHDKGGASLAAAPTRRPPAVVDASVIDPDAAQADAQIRRIVAANLGRPQAANAATPAAANAGAAARAPVGAAPASPPADDGARPDAATPLRAARAER